MMVMMIMIMIMIMMMMMMMVMMMMMMMISEPKIHLKFSNPMNDTILAVIPERTMDLLLCDISQKSTK